MIQRKQTIFLVLSLIVLLLGVYYPIYGVDLQGKGEVSVLFNLCTVGKDIIQGGIVLFFLMVVAFVFDAVAIFLYKNRKKQMRLVSLSTVLLVLWYLYLAVGIKWNHLDAYQWHISLVLPLIAIILNVLAHRGIKADEKLVRSMDRIR